MHITVLDGCFTATVDGGDQGLAWLPGVALRPLLGFVGWCSVTLTRWALGGVVSDSAGAFCSTSP